MIGKSSISQTYIVRGENPTERNTMFWVFVDWINFPNKAFFSFLIYFLYQSKIREESSKTSTITTSMLRHEQHAERVCYVCGPNSTLVVPKTKADTKQEAVLRSPAARIPSSCLHPLNPLTLKPSTSPRSARCYFNCTFPEKSRQALATTTKGNSDKMNHLKVQNYYFRVSGQREQACASLIWHKSHPRADIDVRSRHQ